MAQPDKKTGEKRGSGGRPSSFRPEYAEKLLSFFNVEPPCKFPTLARFAATIGVSRMSLYEWATAKNPDGSKKHPEFSDAYEKAKDFQEAILVEGAMAGTFAQAFSIFTAKNVLGWRDKQEVEHSGGVTVHIAAKDAALL